MERNHSRLRQATARKTAPRSVWPKKLQITKVYSTSLLFNSQLKVRSEIEWELGFKIWFNCSRHHMSPRSSVFVSRVIIRVFNDTSTRCYRFWKCDHFWRNNHSEIKDYCAGLTLFEGSIEHPCSQSIMISELAPFGDLKDFINSKYYSGTTIQHAF